MKPDRAKFRASRMTFSEFQASTNVTETARRSADRIIAAARATAEQITADLDRRQAALNARIQGMTDNELREFIDSQTLASSAKAIANLLSEASRIRSEFETLTPWLSTLVEKCISKIIGQLDDDTLMAKMGAQGVSEMQADHMLTLRVPSSDHARLLTIAERWPNAFAAVQTIMPDANVPEGELVLEGAAGLIKLGLSRSLNATLDNIEKALDEQHGTPTQ